MKILITENQLKKLIENILIEQDIELEKKKFYKQSNMKIWFYENVVTQVKEITKPGYPDNIYYIDKDTNETYMVYYKKDRYFRVDYNEIWSYFESNYSHNDTEIRQLIKDLVGEHYNLWNIRVYGGYLN